MKRLACVILALAILMCSAVCARAESYLDYGDWLVSFSEEHERSFVLRKYRGSSADIVIPDSKSGYHIVTVYEHLFSNDDTVHSVTFGRYMLEVGDYGFFNTGSLSELILNEALCYVGDYAFAETPALTSVNLQDTSLTAINPHTFYNSGIVRIALPDSCVSIGNGAFANCSSLTRIDIPDSVTEIADNAFDNSGSAVIYCTTDSYAHQYAEAKGIDFVLIDAAVEVTFILGDADGDGKITIMDATKVQRLLAELITDDDAMIALRGDCGGNGLDILDATKIQRSLADLEVEEPIGTEVTRTVIPKSV